LTRRRLTIYMADEKVSLTLESLSESTRSFSFAQPRSLKL
jgi:hypothetical protein